jgi:hypothetical protein
VIELWFGKAVANIAFLFSFTSSNVLQFCTDLLLRCISASLVVESLIVPSEEDPIVYGIAITSIAFNI